MKPRILFSIPSQSHVGIALDEMYGMKRLGYTCGEFNYAGRSGYDSQFAKLYILIRNALSLLKLSWTFRPDIIYLNSRLEVIAGMRDTITIFIVKCFYRRRVQFVIKSHGSDIEVVNDARFFVKKIIMPFLRRHVSGWLLLSEEEKRGLIDTRYFDIKKLFVTKNIIRFQQFAKNHLFRESLSIPSNHTILLFSGRLIPEKGIAEVIRAFAVLRSSHNATLIVVGSGSAFSEVKTLCDTLGVTNHVRFTGFISEDEVVPFYSNCDILVFPTYFPEGFPMALFNAVSAGMAIITTPTRAAVDYLREPLNCLWVEPKNAGSVSQALESLCTDAELMKEMKRNNKKLGPEFGQGRVCEGLSEILNKLHFMQSRSPGL